MCSETFKGDCSARIIFQKDNKTGNTIIRVTQKKTIAEVSPEQLPGLHCHKLLEEQNRIDHLVKQKMSTAINNKQTLFQKQLQGRIENSLKEDEILS